MVCEIFNLFIISLFDIVNYYVTIIIKLLTIFFLLRCEIRKRSKAMFPTFSFDMLLTEYLCRINFLFSSFFLRRVCRSCAYKAANNLVLIQTRDCKDICQTTKNLLEKKEED